MLAVVIVIIVFFFFFLASWPWIKVGKTCSACPIFAESEINSQGQ